MKICGSDALGLTPSPLFLFLISVLFQGITMIFLGFKGFLFNAGAVEFA